MALRRKFFVGCCLLAAASCAVTGAEVQVKTLDGQIIQGDYLNTENNLVRIRTRFGLIQIPSKDVVIIQAVQGSALVTPIIPEGKGNEARDPAPVPSRGPEQALPKSTFPKAKRPDLRSMLALRTNNAIQLNISKQNRQELLRLTRNFSDSSNRARNEIVQNLKGYGLEAYPFIAASYTHPTQIFDRAELLHALAVPNSPLTVGIFDEAHKTAWAVHSATLNTPAPPPPDYLSKRDRERFGKDNNALRETATTLLDIENSASIAGGPLNALLLLDVYQLRYDTETSDALLWDIKRDKGRLGSAANDATKSKTGWSAEDRVLVAEQAFPLLFREDENLKELPRDLLKKILPSGYPKWDAPEDEWVSWWDGAKGKLLKGKK
jgi:hypothetical protein